MKELEVMDLMLRDMEEAPALYRPTNFWAHGLEAIVNDLRRHGMASFRSLSSCLRFFVPTYAFPKWLSSNNDFKAFHDDLTQIGINTRVAHMSLEAFFSGRLQALGDYRVYLASAIDAPPYTDEFSESPVGRPLEQFSFEGKMLSRSALNYLLGLNFLKKHIDCSGMRVVLEIGGGFGTLGEILLSDKRNDIFYINVDIPPTAAVSTYYLKEVFGKETIGDYKRLRKTSILAIESLSRMFKAVVLCPWQLPMLEGNVDLFVNFISFQEMEPDIVKNYKNHVKRLGAHIVLLRNLREGKQKATTPNQLGVLEPLTSHHYDEIFHEYKLVATNTLPYGYLTVDGFHSELRLYSL